MEYYRNLSGVSRVHAFETGEESITVQMDSETTMQFTYAGVGKETVERMKVMAAAGSGLHRYIQSHSNIRYELQARETKRSVAPL